MSDASKRPVFRPVGSLGYSVGCAQRMIRPARIATELNNKSAHHLRGGSDMNELTNGVSWLGVIAGAAVSFLAGWLWYSEILFGRRWAEGSRVQLGTATSMPVGALVSQAIGLFLMSWFVGVTAVSNALLTVVLATVAFTVLNYSGGTFSQKSAYARAVDAGYWLLCLIVMVVCQGIF